MSRENVEVVRSSLDGWSRGDIGAWLAPCHPDIEFRHEVASLDRDEVLEWRDGLQEVHPVPSSGTRGPSGGGPFADEERALRDALLP